MNKKNKILPEVHIQSIFALYSNGHIQEALDTIKALIKDYPNDPWLYNISGVCYKSINQLDSAVQSFEKALSIKSDDIKACFNLGIIYMEIGQLDTAVKFYEKVLALNLNNTDAQYNLAITFEALGQVDAAVKSYEKVLALKPDHFASYNNLGVIFNELGQFEKAITSYKKAITIKPDLADAYNNLGASLSELGNQQGAVTSYKKAITIKPDFAEACNNLGNVLKDLGQLDAAVISYKKAITIKLDFADAHNNLGITLKELGQLDFAVKNFEKALIIKPDFTGALNNLGMTLKYLGQHEAAIKCYKKALSLEPNFAEVYRNHGDILLEHKLMDEALVNYESAFALNPNLDFLLGDYLHTKMSLGIWDDLVSHLNELRIKVNNGEKVISPFPMLGLIDNPEIQRKNSEIYIKTFYPQNYDLSKIKIYPKHKKIRIGYFSADFREHPVAYLTAELYEIHDRSQFEIHAFSYGLDTNDKMNLRIKAGVDHFYDVRKMSNKEISIFSRSLEIDIAVDLGGLTQGSRMEIFAMASAPIQLSYIGYPGAIGANYYDYLLADQEIIPDKYQKYYSEKIVYLPSFQVNDSTQLSPEVVFTREDLGLPKEGFVFCCFNNTYKITPNSFDSWGRILKKVDGSVLLIYADNESAQINLTKEITARGIDPKRLIFGKRLSKSEYLARYRVADLFLDTHPFNAGTTASDALRMGLPLLTHLGQSFASRMGASIVSAINLPELIATSEQDYESIAIELATFPEKLKIVKDKLANNLSTAPLYDTPLFAKRLESAYLTMYETYQHGLDPDHIYVNY